MIDVGLAWARDRGSEGSKVGTCAAGVAARDWIPTSRHCCFRRGLLGELGQGAEGFDQGLCQEESEVGLPGVYPAT